MFPIYTGESILIEIMSERVLEPAVDRQTEIEN